MSNTKRWIISVLLLLTSMLIAGCNQTHASKVDPDKVAVVGAKKVITAALIVPETARFGSFSIVESTPNNFYLVKVTVEAENTYGEMITADMHGILRDNGNKYKYKDEYSLMAGRRSILKIRHYKFMSGWK